MNQLHLTPADLATRWGCHIGTLANARSNRSIPHPGYLKFGNRVLYPLAEVEAFESAHFVPALVVA